MRQQLTASAKFLRDNEAQLRTEGQAGCTLAAKSQPLTDASSLSGLLVSGSDTDNLLGGLDAVKSLQESPDTDAELRALERTAQGIQTESGLSQGAGRVVVESHEKGCQTSEAVSDGVRSYCTSSNLHQGRDILSGRQRLQDFADENASAQGELR